MVLFTTIASALAPLIIEGLTKLEKGGDVKKTEMALVHKGEFMLPKGVKPTKTQRLAVLRGKAKGKGNKKVAPSVKKAKKSKKQKKTMDFK
tara:strand:+ start:439 stop:711 length:273 start_codon:yes stop_codon:yes gene_type:complete